MVKKIKVEIESYVDLVNIRHKVFARIAKMAYDDVKLNELEKASFEVIPGEVVHFRDSVFRERAIVDERLRLTMGTEASKPIEFHKVIDGMLDI